MALLNKDALKEKRLASKILILLYRDFINKNNHMNLFKLIEPIFALCLKNLVYFLPYFLN